MCPLIIDDLFILWLLTIINLRAKKHTYKWINSKVYPAYPISPNCCLWMIRLESIFSFIIALYCKSRLLWPFIWWKPCSAFHWAFQVISWHCCISHLQSSTGLMSAKAEILSSYTVYKYPWKSTIRLHPTRTK